MAAEKPTDEELRLLIESANAENALLAARDEMIGLFESDDWEIVGSAETSGREILRGWGEQATQWAIADYCLQRLKTGFPIRAIGMGQPQGSLGIGYVEQRRRQATLHKTDYRGRGRSQAGQSAQLSLLASAPLRRWHMAENTTNTGGRCSMCGHSPLESRLIDKTFDYGADDETITVTAYEVPVRVCANCGEYYSGREAARVEHEAICQALGLEPPSRIKALREQFGWSQQYLADLAEIGIATLSRIERGRLVQSRSVNGILRDLHDCRAFREHRERLLKAKTTESGSDVTKAPLTSEAAHEPPTHANRLGAGNGGACGVLDRIKLRNSNVEEHRDKCFELFSHHQNWPNQ